MAISSFCSKLIQNWCLLVSKINLSPDHMWPATCSTLLIRHASLKHPKIPQLCGLLFQFGKASEFFKFGTWLWCWAMSWQVSFNTKMEKWESSKIGGSIRCARRLLSLSRWRQTRKRVASSRRMCNESNGEHLCSPYIYKTFTADDVGFRNNVCTSAANHRGIIICLDGVD
jgi:hypothetical protein